MPYRWLPILAYLGFLTWASLAPAATFEYVPIHFRYEDKLFHFLIYGGLVALARWTLAPRWTLRPSFWPVVLGAIAYGGLMELLQSLIVSYGRSFDLLDIVANTLGALCFWFLTRRFFHPPPSALVAQASPPAK